MKKVLIAALAAIAVLTGATSAWAQSQNTHWAIFPLKFRSHAATQVTTGDFKPFNDFGTLDAIDSTAGSGIAKFDTTTSFPTGGLGIAPAGGAVDSATVMRLFVYDAGLPNVTAGQTSATAESIYIKAQVSVNNSKWFDAAVIPGGSPVLVSWTLQTGANPGVVAFTASQNTGISDKMWSIVYFKGQAAAGRKDAIDINHLQEFPYVRWILSGSRTLNHSWKASVGYYTTQNSVQP